MRLHALSIAAFGPFVDTVHVDFDELAAGGVFLLTGDTGAGKTSVLDAVCFALYGEVPGDRHGARHLRSDHADPRAEPSVVLRVSIAERTFRFTRSPSWDRPKQRGTGTTRVPAHVIVEEQRSGDWLTLTNRLDEAGQLVTDLLGMTCTQFTQVAMLPQGRFQAFLRATSTERHDVLQRLFRTRRFEEVERWLAERRNLLRRRSQTCHDRAAGVLNRIQEAAGVSTPEDWDLHDLHPVLGDGALLPWARDLTHGAVGAAAALELELTTASQELELRTQSYDIARQLAQARARGEEAQRTLDHLAQTADVEAALGESVEAHRRAASVLPTALRAENAAETAAATGSEAAAHAALVAPVVGLPVAEVRPESLDRAATRASEARAVAESWLPRESELHDERARLTSLSAQKARLAAEIAAGEQESARLAGSRERLVPLLGEARTLAARGAADLAAVTAAEAGLAAAREATALAGQVGEAHLRLQRSTERAQDLRDRYLDLRERRISGMAAELAAGLAAGCSCPVCGSADHPSPALASGRVSRADEDTARQRYETGDFERQAVVESVSALDGPARGSAFAQRGTHAPWVATSPRRRRARPRGEPWRRPQHRSPRVRGGSSGGTRRRAGHGPGRGTRHPDGSDPAAHRVRAAFPAVGRRAA